MFDDLTDSDVNHVDGFYPRLGTRSNAIGNQGTFHRTVDLEVGPPRGGCPRKVFVTRDRPLGVPEDNDV